MKRIKLLQRLLLLALWFGLLSLVSRDEYEVAQEAADFAQHYRVEIDRRG